MSNTSLDQFLHNLTFHAKMILPEAWARLDAYGDGVVNTKFWPWSAVYSCASHTNVGKKQNLSIGFPLRMWRWIVFCNIFVSLYSILSA
jgi:hypothetical protein